MWGNAKVKKASIIVLTAVLLILAVYFNYRVNQRDNAGVGGEAAPEIIPSENSADTPAMGAGVNYFSAYRESREQQRAKEIEYLRLIINDERTDSETLQDAQEQLMDIVSGMEMEFTLEQLLLAKGFNDVAVTFHNGSINVIVDAATLAQEQVAQILEVVIRETGEQAGNVKVASKRPGA